MLSFRPISKTILNKTSLNIAKRSFSAARMTAVPATQKAFVVVKKNEALAFKDVPVKTPGPGQVLLKLKAAGVCHSDLHLQEGALIELPAGSILGHEIVGSVAAIGEGVSPKDFPVSDSTLYAAHGPNPCGNCKECRGGYDNLCSNTINYGLGFDGGYAQYTISSTHNLLKVPEGVSPEVAAVTTDAVLTPYHALKMAKINGLSRILIIGLGGLGINAVQIAKSFGAHVTAFDLRESSRKLAADFGADVVLESLTLETPSGGYDFVADVVGAQSTFDLAISQVKKNGTVIPIGLASDRLSFDLSTVCLSEIKILGSFWGTSLDQVEVFELVKSGAIKPQVETGNFRDLNAVLDRLRRGEIKSRLVLTNFENVD